MTPGPTQPAPRRHPPGRCPTCGKPSAPSGEVRPFCSVRCQQVDLGRWLRGDYVVPGEAVNLPPPGTGEDSPDDDR
jgi:endogenous inhibitor of DNA gyrase (YacG/DUF329 family)